MKRRSLSFLLVLPFLAAPAVAQTSALCDDLRARLADLREVIGNNPETRQYANAIAQQNLEIRKVQNDLRDYGCSGGSFVIINGENAPMCDELHAALDRMRDNIRYLIDRRNQINLTSRPDDELRRHLLASLEENGCNEASIVTPDALIDPDRDIGRRMPEETFIPPMGSDPRDIGNYPGPREYPTDVSTVCVRTCDGGFFPLSSHAGPNDFQRDAETCARMCPGVQTELFYRFLSTQEADDMVSVSTGAPYSAMPNAFAYRNRPPGEKSSCTCNFSAYYEQLRRNGEQTSMPESSITRIETKKSQPTSTTALNSPAQPPERPYDPAANKVRQVGPQFLDDAQGRIDLKNPALPGPQPQQ